SSPPRALPAFPTRRSSDLVAEVGDGAAAVRRALEDDVDLAVIDITMPRMTGLQAARELHRRRPALRILMLSMHENERYLYEALRSEEHTSELQSRGHLVCR